MTSSNVRVAAPRAGQTSRPAAVTGRLSDVWQQVRQNLKTTTKTTTQERVRR